MGETRPFYEDVQAHYDLSNDLCALFLDPSMTYSCAYFEREDMSLEEAQLAKIDLALGKCDLQAGMTLLDIGCGWGSTARRAASKYDTHVIGLTLSVNQHEWAMRSFREVPTRAGAVDIRLQGWEEFDEPVDRIVTIGAFEHFRVKRFPMFFDRCRSILPSRGRMLLHTILQRSWQELNREGVRIDHETVEFAKFVRKSIFPGGQLVAAPAVIKHAARAGFECIQTESLRPHYAKTLDHWAVSLEAARDEAIAITSRETYDTYMRYLTGCAEQFRVGSIDVMQFTLSRT